ncbi:hypothetical protein GE107_18260 [Cohnella sp. CFH 77786]|uniref:hypothetical protein n=1 Tax=Cohnella sp. CFH 77786 TaxID=2662265 RepID=UPI001C60D8B4|nr:hypothetical protein [Cohnella sp. CFH 77786]MBW5448003.1 hypothetical protein [Cohnella sp. CFH 77786]
MNKKWWMAGAGLTLGAAMLTVGGLSAMANTSGYEAYKSALKNTHAQTSLTAQAELTVTDNGTALLKGNANVKWNEDADAQSVAATFADGTTTRSMDVYRQDGKVIVKDGDSDVYKVLKTDDPQEEAKWKAGGHEPPKAVEQAIDLLAGHMRELAAVKSESDGGKHASLHLTGSQIPAALNAAVMLLASGAADHDFGKPAGADHPDVKLPELTEDIRVEAVNLDADITPDNVLERQTAEIRVSGTDAGGKTHDLVLGLRIDFTDANRTSPDRIDLTGKPTEEIKPQENGRGWHR